MPFWVFLLMFLSMILLILLILNFSWIIYGIYYAPLYALFGGSLYLPFYLHIVNSCLFMLMVVLLFAGYLWSCKNENGKPDITASAILSLIIIGIVYFPGKDIYSDIVFIGKEKYLKTECRISSLHRHGGKGLDRYEIVGMKKVNGRRITVEMNFYQYAELSEIKEAQDKINNSIYNRFYTHEKTDRIITVYYLPHTKRMLKYE